MLYITYINVCKYKIFRFQLPCLIIKAIKYSQPYIMHEFKKNLTLILTITTNPFKNH